MKVYEFIDSPEKWTKGVNARDANGREVEQESPNAVCWCTYGAVHKCYTELDGRKDALARLSAVVGTPLLGMDWNDLEETTYDIFIAKVKEADV